MDTNFKAGSSLQSFRGKIANDKRTHLLLQDSFYYIDKLNNQKHLAYQALTPKEIKQFHNTLKFIKKDKTNNVLEIGPRLYLPSPRRKTKDTWNIQYGNYKKEPNYRYYEPEEREAVRHIIELGKTIFGEKKLNKPISDLEKVKLSRWV